MKNKILKIKDWIIKKPPQFSLIIENEKEAAIRFKDGHKFLKGEIAFYPKFSNIHSYGILIKAFCSDCVNVIITHGQHDISDKLITYTVPINDIMFSGEYKTKNK